MKKAIFLFAALLMAGSLFVSCSDNLQPELEKEDNGSPLPSDTYTFSVVAKKGVDTKALAFQGENIVATWEEGETVTVYNVTQGVELQGTLSPRAEDYGKASAILTGTVEGPVNTGNELKLKFLAPDYSGQDGTLAYISAHCDYAEATVTVTHDETSHTISSTNAADFENKQAIVKFTLKDKENAVINPTALAVNFSTGIVVLTGIPATTYTVNNAGVLYVAIPAFSSQTVTINALANGNYYTLMQSGASITNGKLNPITITMTKVPEGALPSEFSISKTEKTRFAKGNLQYSTSTSKYTFADNQWSFLSYADGNFSTTGQRDLFSWGTGNNPMSMTIAELNSFYDWGWYVGENWATLSQSQWKHVCGRNEGSKYGLGQIDDNEAEINIDGLILLPDHWTLPDGCSFVPGTETRNKYTVETWSRMEIAGAVFLPAAGARGSTNQYISGEGYYWSSNTEYSDVYHAVSPISLFFRSTFDPNRPVDQNRGCSVRLCIGHVVPLPGVFTIGAGTNDKVQFSRGNLRYDTATEKYFLADNQYDIVGNLSGTVSDLLTWSVVGDCNNLPGLSTGWKVLTNDEWHYLLFTREYTTNGYRFLRAIVNNKKGLVIFPDNYSGTAFSNVNDSYAEFTTIENWSTLEEAGCVFLPIAGRRDGGGYISDASYYWSSTRSNETNSYALYIGAGSIDNTTTGRQNGCCIRLVKAYINNQ